MGEEEYGLAITAIREIRGWSEITVLPDSPPHIRGVLDLRGSIVPIIDLRARFGQWPTTVGPRHVIIVAAAGNRSASLLVDAALVEESAAAHGLEEQARELNRLMDFFRTGQAVVKEAPAAKAVAAAGDLAEF